MQHLAGFSDIANGMNQSDIDCLLLALRHVLKCVSKDGSLTRADPPREHHLVMQLAIKGPKVDPEGLVRTQIRAAITTSSFNDKYNGAYEPAFIRTSECNDMQTTVWCLPFAALWLPDVFTRAKTEGADWVKLDKENKIFTSLTATSDALIQYNPAALPAELRALGAFVSRSHGIFDTPEFQLKLLPAAPASIRVRFYPDGVHVFEDVCRFTYKIDEARPYDYRICAAIRLRSSDDGHDVVRLYDSKQKPIPVAPWGSNETKASYMDDDWKVGDAGHQYVLYYVAVQVANDVAKNNEIVASREVLAQVAGNPTEEEKVVASNDVDQWAGNWSEEDRVAALEQINHYSLCSEDRL